MAAVRDEKGHFVKISTTPEEQEAAVRDDVRRATGYAVALDGLVAALKQERLVYHNLVLLARKTQMGRRGPLTDVLQTLTGLEDED